MTDVAQAAGVSQSTVSMVLNNMTGARLSAETRSKVLGVAMELGYRLPRREAPAPAAAFSVPFSLPSSCGMEAYCNSLARW